MAEWQSGRGVFRKSACLCGTLRRNVNIRSTYIAILLVNVRASLACARRPYASRLDPLAWRSCACNVLQVRDAKCLHAHVADALMRGRDANAIGRSTLELLEARGVRTDGGDRCSEQCNYRVEETAESWR